MTPNDLTFNGKDLSEILYINSIDKGVNLGKRSRLNTRTNRLGVDYLGFTSEVVTIETPFSFKPEVTNKKERLADILNVDEPKPLTIRGEPGKVYYAFPVSDIESDETSIFGGGTITWEIADGVAYSETLFTFTNNGNDYIAVHNPGTESMQLELQCDFLSDNGFIGVESEDGSTRALFGSMSEVDKTPYEMSETIFDDHMYQDRGWTLNDGVVPPVTSNPTQQGTVGYRLESDGEGYAFPGSYGTPTNEWSGPSLTKQVGTDSSGEYPKYWESNFRLDFNTDGGGSRNSQVGHQSVTFSDQNGDIIVAVVIEDNHPSASKSDFAVYIKNKRVYDSRNTDSYYVTARPGEGNHIRVEKWKTHIRVAFKGIDTDSQWLTFNTTDDEDIRLRKITWYSARFGNRNPMTNNLLRAINVIAHKVQKWNDIPNKFKDGDRLSYGRSGRNIYCLLNDMSMLGLRDPGSSMIDLPPGDTLMYISYSDFATTPTVRLQGNARFII